MVLRKLSVHMHNNDVIHLLYTKCKNSLQHIKYLNGSDKSAILRCMVIDFHNFSLGTNFRMILKA